MTILINDTSPRVQYTAMAAQTTFTYPFEIFEDADIKVFVTPNGQTANDATDLKTLTTDYTVTNAGQTGGGNVVLVVASTAGDVVTIERDVPVKRITDYTALGDFFAADLNEDLDRLTAMVQQQEKTLERTTGLPSTVSSTVNPKLPVPSPNVVLQWDASGLKLINGPTADALASAEAKAQMDEDIAAEQAIIFAIALGGE